MFLLKYILNLFLKKRNKDIEKLSKEKDYLILKQEKEIKRLKEAFKRFNKNNRFITTIMISTLLLNFTLFGNEETIKKCKKLNQNLIVKIKEYQKKIIILKTRLNEKELYINYEKKINELNKRNYFVPSLGIIGILNFTGKDLKTLEPSIGLNLTWYFN